MNHQPDRASELFLLREEETAPAQLHLVHTFGTKSKRVLQVIGSPQDDLFRVLETGHHEYDHFYHRIKRPSPGPLDQLKSAPNAQNTGKRYPPFRLPMPPIPEPARLIR